MLISIPFVLSSTGYALFSQQLSVTGTATKPAYASSENLSVSYVKTITSSNGSWNYQISVTIKNNGTNGVTAWQSQFSLPSDFSALSCTNSLCSQSGTTNTAKIPVSTGLLIQARR